MAGNYNSKPQPSSSKCNFAVQSFEGLVLISNIINILDCAQDRRLDGARARILTSGRLYHRIGNIGNLTLSCQKMNNLNGRSQIEIAKLEMGPGGLRPSPRKTFVV